MNVFLYCILYSESRNAGLLKTQRRQHCNSYVGLKRFMHRGFQTAANVVRRRLQVRAVSRRTEGLRKETETK